MAQANEPAIKVKAITQVGIPVTDIDQCVKDYWEKLGIGPWTMVGVKPPDSYDLMYNEKPTTFKFKVSLITLGGFEFELMQTLEGHSEYDDFIAAHDGEGANHLQYIVDNVAEMDGHAATMAKLGIHSVMSGRLVHNGAFNYLDTTATLKTIFEPVRMPDDPNWSTYLYPADEKAVSPAKVIVKAISRVGLVVKDVEAVIRDYISLVGIGPWKIYEAKSPLLHDQTYHGKPADFTMKVGVAKAGAIELELIQPLSGDSIYRDFLAKHGEGIHHVQFEVDDLAKTTKLMAEEGFPVLMAAGLQDGGFAYFNTINPLKVIWQAYQPPKSAIPMTPYP